MNVLEMSERFGSRNPVAADPRAARRHTGAALILACAAEDPIGDRFRSAFGGLSDLRSVSHEPALTRELEALRSRGESPAAVVISDSLAGGSWPAPWPFLRGLSEELSTDVLYLASETALYLYRNGRLEVEEPAHPEAQVRMAVAFAGIALSRRILASARGAASGTAGELRLAA
jgi:hypothetical protein